MKNENKSKKGKKSELYFYITLGVVLVVFFSLFLPVRVQGESMESTLLNGDLLLMKRSWLVSEYVQGDIVVAAKDSFHNGECIIKRIIAVEGQTVNIDNETGLVYVDGVALDEPYSLTPTYEKGELDFPITVAENCYFVLGDNREESLDSRYSQIGQVHKDEIQGKIIWLIVPGIGDDRFDFNRIGTVS